MQSAEKIQFPIYLHPNPSHLMLFSTQCKLNLSPLPSFRVKPCQSPHVTSLKIAYETTRKNKLLNIFQNMAQMHMSPKMKTKRKNRTHDKKCGVRSNFQIYKDKQMFERQKLQQVHSIEKPKQKSNQFYCTMRIRERKWYKKSTNTTDESLQLGTLKSARSEIHNREQMRKQFVKTPRQCLTQCAQRNQIYSTRKYSLDIQQMRILKFGRDGKNLRRNFTFQGPCRPWSPADEQEPQINQCPQFLTIF